MVGGPKKGEVRDEEEGREEGGQSRLEYGREPGTRRSMFGGGLVLMTKGDSRGASEYME